MWCACIGRPDIFNCTICAGIFVQNVFQRLYLPNQLLCQVKKKGKEMHAAYIADGCSAVQVSAVQVPDNVR